MADKILNNERHPSDPGMYETVDSSGYESFQYWSGTMWKSTTGHPIEYWIEKLEPTDRDIERMLEQ